jgi:sulfide:quinone oxidoreductase
MSQTVLVLGGGVGGLVAAHELRRRLTREHRVTLVDRQTSFVFAPSLLWVMIGTRTIETISRPLSRLAKKGIEIVRGEIQDIDAGRREAMVEGRTLSGDYLVIALGAELAAELVPGLAEAGHNLYSPVGAEGLRDALGQFGGGKIVVLTAAPTYKCPAAPYEAAMLLEHLCRKRQIRTRTQIDLYAAEPGPMGVAGPEVSAAVRQMVEAKGIGYYPEHQITRVDPAARTLHFANGVARAYDMLAYVPPHRAPAVVRKAGLCGESGWITVDRHTFATQFACVFALGDVVSVPLSLGKPLPKAGVFAHGEAEVVARNIARAITGKGKAAAFGGDGACFVEAGGGRAGYGAGDFYAEPSPRVTLRPPSRRWHAAKVLFEKDWLRRWF